MTNRSAPLADEVMVDRFRGDLVIAVLGVQASFAHEIQRDEQLQGPVDGRKIDFRKPLLDLFRYLLGGEVPAPFAGDLPDGDPLGRHAISGVFECLAGVVHNWKRSWVSPGHALLTLWQDVHVALGPIHLPSTLAITEPGLLSAAHLVLRVTAVVSFAALLTLTTKWDELLKSLRVLRAPKMFVFMLAMAYRYVHLLARLLRDMLLARKSRMVGPSSAAENRRFLGASAAALFGKSQAMGEQVYSAMLARGYQGEVQTLESWRLRWLDLVWALGITSVFAVTIWLGLTPGRGF